MSASLYIHIPFCRHKCAYCDFYSITSLNHIEKFIPALWREIELWAADAFFQNQQFSTLYLGGGTPSLLSPQHISDILQKLKSSFHFNPDTEISMEANPGAIFQQNLQGYWQAGVNRLTLGVQSFNDAELKFLTRIHSAVEAEAAFVAARNAGFDNIGIDLIFGLPGQSLKSWEKNCRRALELVPEHISMYGLTYEENTPLYRQLERGSIQRCDEELDRDMFLLGIDLLTSAGYEQYEISNFARPGFASRHNQKYWDSSPFLSLGPSAHSFDGDGRWWNVSDLHHYLKSLENYEKPLAGSEQLSIEERIEEFLMLGLRRKSGIDLDVWHELTNRTTSDLLSSVRRTFGELDMISGFDHSKTGRSLTLNENHLCLTQQGLLLYNTVCEKISLL